jgi:hypothetical protein
LRELVATGLAELEAQVLAISPIPTTSRVTVAFGLEATSEQEARERIADAISSAGRFGALGWSIASLYTSAARPDATPRRAEVPDAGLRASLRGSARPSRATRDRLRTAALA